MARDIRSREILAASIFKGGKEAGDILLQWSVCTDLGFENQNWENQKGGDLGMCKKANGKNPVQKQVRLRFLSGLSISSRR